MRKSAGIIRYRRAGGVIEVLLVHPGGPFWSRKDEGAWSIPKGQMEDGEEEQTTARREFREEVGQHAEGPLQPLGSVRQKGGKTVHAFAQEGDLDISTIESTRFSLEWPPRSGQLRDYPEVDRASWFTLVEARAKMLPSQLPLLDRLEALLQD
ncbi:NUDIX domain-containing protein [Ancylobacter amanitiformis]|uniref:NUDIX family NTP pyrophosphohydrolase n=1 Tax=Ancylobacter amanitiformis TaxID=217069 RepID=A0ABU0LMB1_9HYPH|nr:NUDIX domain-containing protein [Ancylobacter amanitiformis]MDQ0509842.1 putative NUDIX family NTP pyrophosphohydrolase [Ancylobacter amanitiformis]